MGALSISAQMGVGLGPRHTGGGTPTPTPTPAPSFSVQPSITGTPQVGVGFVGTPGTASNTTGHTYRWLLATTSGGTYTAISGATSTSYTPVSGDETKYLKFEDTATGPGGSTVATTAFAGPVAAAATIDAPVLSNLSSGWTTGDNPTAWKSAYANVQAYASGSGAGDQVKAHWKLGPGAWTTTAWEPLDDELATGIGVPWPFLTDGSLNAGGAFQVYEEIVRDLGLPTEQLSVPSNIWTDTLSAYVAPSTGVKWNPADKASDISLSVSNTQVNSSWDGNWRNVRSVSHASSGKGVFAVRVDGLTNDNAIGMAVSTMPTNVQISPTDSSDGYYASGVLYGSGGYIPALPTYGAGNTITIAYDFTTPGSFKFWAAKDGTWINSGNPTAGTGGFSLPDGDYYAVCSLFSSGTQFTSVVPSALTGFTPLV